MLRSDLLKQPLKRTFVPLAGPGGSRAVGNGKQAVVTVKKQKQGGDELAISVPTVALGGAFAAREYVELSVIEEHGKLRWVLVKVPPSRSCGTLCPDSPGRLIYRRTSIGGFSTLTSQLPQSHFSVAANIRLEDVQGEPGVKVLVIEIEEALQGQVDHKEKTEMKIGGASGRPAS